MGQMTSALMLQLAPVSTSWSNHLHCDPGTQFLVLVIIYVKTPSLPLLGDLSAETNIDFNITCEKK